MVCVVLQSERERGRGIEREVVAERERSCEEYQTGDAALMKLPVMAIQLFQDAGKRG